MRLKSTSIIVFTLFLAVPCFGDAVLTVMSFNVRYGTANDGDNAWEKRRDIAVAAVREYDPLVIGTQECLDFQAEYLTQQMPEYRWFGVGREADGTGERMAVLYRAKEVSPIMSGNFWLSDTPTVPGSMSWNTACTRMATWAMFYHYASKQYFYFVNTHLDHKSEPARQGGAKALAKFFEKLPNNSPVVLTGDFNSKAGDSEAYTILTGNGLADSWVMAQEKVGPSVTWSGFKAPEPNVDRRIDWILTRGSIAVDRSETVTFNQDGRYPSDHFPVVALLTLKTSDVSAP